jgi:hypothetical protein
MLCKIEKKRNSNVFSENMNEWINGWTKW